MPAETLPAQSLPSSATDATLVREVASGSEPALATLYDRHAPLVFGAALRLTSDHTRAEEVVMETFLALWNHADRYDPVRGSLGAWLTVIARHIAIDLHRRRSNHDATLSLAAVTGGRDDPGDALEWVVRSSRLVGAARQDDSPVEAVEAIETNAELTAALVHLPDDERAAILLAYRDGLSQSEIATRLGWPLGTVKTRSRRALRRLRGLLSEPGRAGDRDPMSSRAA